METQVKERLTGAVILVTLFVLLVPELLTGGSGKASPPQADGKSVPGTAGAEPAVRTYNIDLVQGGVRQEQASPFEPDLTAKALNKGGSGDPDATVEPAKAAAEQVAAQPQPLAAAGVDPGTETKRDATMVEKPVPSVALHAAPQAAAERASGAGSSATGWAVQLGSFASRDNAQRLVKQLKGKGYSAFVLGGGGSSGKLYRVRVGPEPDQAAANALAATLRSAGHKGSVVSQR